MYCATVETWSEIYKKECENQFTLLLLCERVTGFEPATPGLGSQCSTAEPHALDEQNILYNYKWELSRIFLMIPWEG